ncbi:SsgA family sporulation/cell division regulator [Streptomyces diastatochromogenes]|nr:SsgA family sporulation/cell division regulator [Streptomyces diastatochromogenes]
MSGERSGVQARRSTAGSPLHLTLNIERVLTLTTRQDVRAEFRFAPDAPWAVSVRFAVSGGPSVQWRIGRDLLQQGLHSMSGLGSIRMWPSGVEERATAWLRLTSGDMAALFELPVPPLAKWLECTYRLVPADAELAEVDWNTAVTALLRAPKREPTEPAEGDDTQEAPGLLGPPRACVAPTPGRWPTSGVRRSASGARRSALGARRSALGARRSESPHEGDMCLPREVIARSCEVTPGRVGGPITAHAAPGCAARVRHACSAPGSTTVATAPRGASVLVRSRRAPMTPAWPSAMVRPRP